MGILRLWLGISVVCVAVLVFAAEDLLDKVAPELQVAEWFNVPKHRVQEYSLSALRGKVVLLVFWRVGSEVSEEALPKIEEFHQQYKEKGLVVIGISRDRPTEISETIRKRQVTFAVAVDDESKTSRRLYKVDKVPTAFIVNAEGIVSWVGSAQKNVEAVKQEIEKALEGVFPFTREIKGFRPKKDVSLKNEVDAVIEGDFRKAIQGCEVILKKPSATEEQKKDASYLLEEIRAYARVVLRSAKTLEKTGEFVAAERLLKTASYQFSALEEGKEIKELHSRYSKDKTLRRQLEADEVYQEYLTLKQEKKIEAAKARLQLLIAKYPETEAGKKAAEIIAAEEESKQPQK